MNNQDIKIELPISDIKLLIKLTSSVNTELSEGELRVKTELHEYFKECIE